MRSLSLGSMTLAQYSITPQHLNPPRSPIRKSRLSWGEEISIAFESGVG